MIAQNDALTTMTCFNGASTLPAGTHFVNYTGCRVYGPFSSLHAEQDAEIKLIVKGHVEKFIPLPQIQWQPFHVVPQMEDLESQAAQIMAEGDDNFSWHLGGLGTVIGFFSIIFIVHRKLLSRPETTTDSNPSWANVWANMRAPSRPVINFGCTPTEPMTVTGPQ